MMATIKLLRKFYEVLLISRLSRFKVTGAVDRRRNMYVDERDKYVSRRIRGTHTASP